ncbi:hypothetical protein V6C03_12860 [Methyloligella sp. 2.7D]
MNFPILGTIRYGWEAFKQRSWLYLAATVIFAVVSLAISMLSVMIDGLLNGWDGPDGIPQESFVGTIFSLALSTLVYMGVTGFYLKAFDAPDRVALSDLWQPHPFWNYLGASVLAGLSVGVGLVLLIVPGIIFALMFAFGTVVVMDRGLGPIKALEESRRITRGHRWRLLGFGLLLGLLNLAGLLAFGLGLLVTVPVSFLAGIYAYRLLEDAAGPGPYAGFSAASRGAGRSGRGFRLKAEENSQSPWRWQRYAMLLYGYGILDWRFHQGGLGDLQIPALDLYWRDFGAVHRLDDRKQHYRHDRRCAFRCAGDSPAGRDANHAADAALGRDPQFHHQHADLDGCHVLLP